MQLTLRQHDTIIAALRLWQRLQGLRPLNLITPLLWEIAVEHGKALTEEEIDALIDRFQVSDVEFSTASRLRCPDCLDVPGKNGRGKTCKTCKGTGVKS